MRREDMGPIRDGSKAAPFTQADLAGARQDKSIKKHTGLKGFVYSILFSETKIYVSVPGKDSPKKYYVSKKNLNFITDHLLKPEKSSKTDEIKPEKSSKIEKKNISSSAKPDSKPITEVPQSVADAIASVEHIEPGFTKNKSMEVQREHHAIAKEYLSENLSQIGATVAFISPAPLASVSAEKDVVIKNDLSKSVFSWENTQGVQGDIQRDGNRKNNDIVVYGVASQFNGCEAMSRHPVEPRNAYTAYKSDYTQGPFAQLQFPEAQVELINNAGHLGFNGLCGALSEETKECVVNGYFTPDKQSYDLVKDQLARGKGIEYLCVGNHPFNKDTREFGSKPVYEIMVAAPAFGYYATELGEFFGEPLESEQQREIEYLCALQAFRAQFAQCIHLAQEEDKKVVFKAAGIGLGVFSNSSTSVAKGFYTAAKEYEKALKDNNVEVRFQVYKRSEEPLSVVQTLGLKEKTGS